MKVIKPIITLIHSFILQIFHLIWTNMRLFHTLVSICTLTHFVCFQHEAVNININSGPLLVLFQPVCVTTLPLCEPNGEVHFINRSSSIVFSPLLVPRSKVAICEVLLSLLFLAPLTCGHLRTDPSEHVPAEGDSCSPCRVSHNCHDSLKKKTNKNLWILNNLQKNYWIAF